MEATVFAGHRGWLHRPAPEDGIRASVVICPPIGREERSAHRSLWLLAEQLSAEGFLVLRYDHLGQGESIELREDEDAWSAWLGGVGQAAELVRAEAPNAPLVLGGLRLGASLAACAAEAVRPDALMLLAPIVKGVAWLRELELQSALLGGPRRHPPGGGLEADSLLFTAATLAQLSALDLLRIHHAAPEAYVAHQGRPKAFMARLEQLGARVTGEGFDGYAELFSEAYLNSPPLELFARAGRWLDLLFQDALPDLSARPIAAPAVLATQGGEETPVSFGAGLRGMLCLPASPSPERRAVLLPNTGGDPRAGVGGFAVQASRALNAGGVAALRFDFAGLGDSAFSPDWRSDVYTTPRGEDFAAAIELLQAHGWTEIIAAGVCSGAYHALHAAIRDERLAGVLAVNPGDWIWSEKIAIASPTRDDLLSSRLLLKDLVRHTLLPGAWRGLLTGEGRHPAIAAALWRKLVQIWLCGPHRSETKELRAGMRSIAARGGRVRVIVGRADSALDEMEVRFGHHGAWLRRLPGASVKVVAGLDHGLACAESRSVILRELLAFAGV